MRRFSILKAIAAASMGVLVVSAFAQTGQGAPPQPAEHAAPKIPGWVPIPDGQKAPNFEVYTTDGKKVHLSDLKGKTVILDFWATWCGPCQVSMPKLERIYQQIKNDDVVVLSVNTWDADKDFKDWVAQNSGTKYNFDFVRDPAEGAHDVIRKKSIAKRLYHVVGIPTQYVIDKNGRVAGTTVGSGSEEDLIKILGTLGITATPPSH